MARAKKNRISILNWMGTLLLCSIPAVNLIALVCFAFFSKSPSKKSFAAAALLLMLIIVVAAAILLVALPGQVAELAALLRQSAATPAP